MDNHIIMSLKATLGKTKLKLGVGQMVGCVNQVHGADKQIKHAIYSLRGILEIKWVDRTSSD